MNILFNKFADAIIKQASKTPYYHLNNYMYRFWLLGGSHRSRDYREDKELSWKRKEWDDFIGQYVAIRVHKIVSSDDDSALHDHPWDFATLILKGGYYEITPKSQSQSPEKDKVDFERRWRGPGSLIIHKAGDRHRLEVPDGGAAHTMFMMGPKRQSWGFYAMKENIKIGFKEYHDKYPNTKIAS